MTNEITTVVKTFVLLVSPQINLVGHEGMKIDGTTNFFTMPKVFPGAPFYLKVDCTLQTEGESLPLDQKIGLNKKSVEILVSRQK